MAFFTMVLGKSTMEHLKSIAKNTADHEKRISAWTLLEKILSSSSWLKKIPGVAELVADTAALRMSLNGIKEKDASLPVR